MPRYNAATSANRLSANVQVDGRLAVRDLHESDTGEYVVRDYLAEAAVDLDSLLEANSMAYLERLATK
jgi:hypothetical protein